MASALRPRSAPPGPMLEPEVGTSIPGLGVLTARREHLQLVRHFILELARYERLEADVVGTEALLEEHLFGPSPKAEVVLLSHYGQAAGFALFYSTFSTFLARPGLFIEDLFVDEQFRGRGFGRTLIAYVAKLAEERGCGRLEWHVLDWNEPALAFYRAVGGERTSGWWAYRMSGAGLTELSRRFR